MSERATRYLDGILRGVEGFDGRVFFGGPPSEGSRNPSIVYAITGDVKYPTLQNPDRVVAVDYEIAVRSNDASTVEQLGQRVWDALASLRRVREIGEYRVDKYMGTDGEEETASEFFARQEYRVRVK